MRIEIIGRDYHADEKLTALLLKKLKRLDRYFGNDVAARLVLSQQSGEYRMDITIFAAPTVRAEASSTDMNDNIDILIPRVTRQFRKERTREIARRKDEIAPKKE
jgi:putative sigma-54 modulation protein